MGVGDSQTGEQWYQRSSPTAVKILSPTSGFPAWGSRKSTGNPQETWPWRPAGFDDRTSTRLRETETPLYKGTNKTCVHQDSAEGSSAPTADWTSQFSSVTQSCLTLGDPMNRRTPGLPVHHQLPEFTQTHIHRVSDVIQPSHPLSYPSPPDPNPSQHQSLFQWVSSSHEVAKVLEFQL